mgnify:CR=1 FL=1
MENYIYAESQPLNRKDFYSAFNVVDFELNDLGRSLVPNSIKLEGDLVITTDGTTQVPANNFEVIRFNRKTGIHGAIESVSCSTVNQGTLESINNYARFIAMEETATASIDDANNASKQVELKATNEIFTGLYSAVQNSVYTDAGGNAQNFPELVDFSAKPRICLNRFSGGNLAFSKTGAMKISFTLARNQAFLHGVVPAGATYKLQNLRICYATEPTEPNPPSVLMNKTINVKSSLSSGLANISANVASSAVKGVSVSFQDQANENVMNLDNYKLEPLPNLKSLQFIFNDSLNKYINFVLKSDSEILEGAVDSFKSMGHNQVNLSEFRKGNSRMVGTSFDDFVDMTRSSFDIQITSDAISNYNVYMYFHSILQM